MSKLQIRIENPISGTGLTSANHARRYVKRGVAEWTSPTTIRMCECHQRASAERTIRPVVSDGSGYATLDGVKNLPCAGDPVKAFRGKRGIVPGEHIHWQVYLLRSWQINKSIPPAAAWPTDLIMNDAERRQAAYVPTVRALPSGRW